MERFFASAKPDPLKVIVPKKEKIIIKDLTKPTHTIKPITDKPEPTNKSINTMPDPKKDRAGYAKWARENGTI